MSDEIQALFDKAVRITGVVGAQLSIIKDGEQSDYVHGMANAELGIPLTSETVIQIGSVTKMFNATMIMSLVEEGTLDLDRPVKSYIPEFKVSDPTATQTISLRHLLSMSAGIDNGDYSDHGGAEDAIARRVAAHRAVPQHFSPGAYFGYSNLATDITGYLAERVTGRSWDDLIKERVTEPAGLKNAVTLECDRMFQRVSVGHRVSSQNGNIEVVRRPWIIPRGLAPAGATLTASAHDLASFGSLFINKGVASSGGRVLAESSVDTMMTAQIDVPIHSNATAWGLGPCKNEWDNVAVWGHRGGNIGGASFLWCLPEKNGVIAWVVNTISAMPRFEKVMAQEVMKLVFGVAKPEVEAPSERVDVDLDRYAGTLTSLDVQCVVETANDKLAMKRTTKDYADPTRSREFIEDLSLIPLGGDRFLIDKGDNTDAMALPDDFAIFGDDGHGRAMNATWFVFPASRTR